jgi:protein-S-isoprenylcysteine O-methyltransferase Ste14
MASISSGFAAQQRMHQTARQRTASAPLVMRQSSGGAVPSQYAAPSRPTGHLLRPAALPGTVAGYVPFGILRAADRLRLPELSPSSVGASILAIAGAVVLLRCVWDFFAKGKGTLAPIDPPRVLVVSGLYRFTRNPMYHGVLALILGEAWLFGSVSLLKYAFLVLVLFHLFVVLYEEPALTSQFGESYRAYRRAVPRWGFTTRPFQEGTGSTA